MFFGRCVVYLTQKKPIIHKTITKKCVKNCKKQMSENRTICNQKCYEESFFRVLSDFGLTTKNVKFDTIFTRKI